LRREEGVSVGVKQGSDEREEALTMVTFNARRRKDALAISAPKTKPAAGISNDWRVATTGSELCGVREKLKCESFKRRRGEMTVPSPSMTTLMLMDAENLVHKGSTVSVEEVLHLPSPGA